MKIKVTKNIPSNIAENIYAILDILKDVGIPFEGQSALRLQRMAQACMAIGGIRKSFNEVKSVKDGTFLRTREILKFENDHYNENISPGSYDDIRRKDLKLLVLANIAINSSALESQATNDGSRGYCLSDEFADLIRAYGTDMWADSLLKYQQKSIALTKELESKRELERVPVKLPLGQELLLS